MSSRSRPARSRMTAFVAHPAFRAIIALWVAALLGLGSFIWTGLPLFATTAASTGAAIGLIAALMAARRARRQSADRTDAADGIVVERINKRAQKILPQRSSAAQFVVQNDIAQKDAMQTDVATTIVPPEERAPEILNIAILPGLDGISPDHAPTAQGDGAAMGPAPTVRSAPEPMPIEQPAKDRPGRMSAADVLRSRDPTEMSLIQLSERFALALEGYRSSQSGSAAPQPAPLPGGQRFEGPHGQAEAAFARDSYSPPLANGALANAAPANNVLPISNRNDNKNDADASERALHETLAKIRAMSRG